MARFMEGRSDSSHSKKDERERVEKFRGVILMPTLYKVYATVLAGRLKKELEEKENMPYNQTGFTKGM